MASIDNMTMSRMEIGDTCDYHILLKANSQSKCFVSILLRKALFEMLNQHDKYINGCISEKDYPLIIITT